MTFNNSRVQVHFQNVIECLLCNTGNDSAIFQGHDSRMISIDQLKTSP